MKLSRSAFYLITVGLFLFAVENVMAIEEAEYQVIRSDQAIEVREYSPVIVAETIVDASFKKAGNRAFRKLFRYIDGNNNAGDKIAMTAPVAQEQHSEKIAMTAPVSQQARGNAWAVSFMMPSSYSMESIPKPNDPTVVLRQVPAKRVAAIRYSGTWSEDRYLEHLEKLLAWVEFSGLEINGEPVFARFDPPFKPWFMRRNEIQIPLN